MHSLYARFVLWLIRPAVERIADQRIAAAMLPGGAVWRTNVSRHEGLAASQRKFFERAIGQRGSAAWKTSSPNDRRRRK